jgi:colicin import membrane protein
MTKRGVVLFFSLCVSLFTVAGGSVQAQSGPDVKGPYTGPNSEWVHRVLRLAGSYSCTADGAPVRPRYYTCERDTAIAKAEQLAWGAECSAQTGYGADALKDAGVLMGELKKAADLCSDKPTGCDTDTVFSCTELATVAASPMTTTAQSAAPPASVVPVEKTQTKVQQARTAAAQAAQARAAAQAQAKADAQAKAAAQAAQARVQAQAAQAKAAAQARARETANAQAQADAQARAAAAQAAAVAVQQPVGPPQESIAQQNADAEADYQRRLQEHNEKVADLRQRADEAESEAEQAESLAQQAKDNGNQAANTGGGILGGLVIALSGGTQLKEELDAQKRRKEADDLREQLRELGEEAPDPPALRNSIEEGANEDRIGEARDRALNNIQATQTRQPQVRSAADTAAPQRTAGRATNAPTGNQTASNTSGNDQTTSGGVTTMPPQPPQYGQPMKSCVSVSGVRKDWVTFQNNCSVAVNVVVVFANQPIGHAIDDRLGPGGSEDAYGNGPSRTSACLHGYQPYAEGIHSLKYSDSEYICVYNGQF